MNYSLYDELSSKIEYIYDKPKSIVLKVLEKYVSGPGQIKVSDNNDSYLIQFVSRDKIYTGSIKTIFSYKDVPQSHPTIQVGKNNDIFIKIVDEKYAQIVLINPKFVENPGCYIIKLEATKYDNIRTIYYYDEDATNFMLNNYKREEITKSRFFYEGISQDNHQRHTGIERIDDVSELIDYYMNEDNLKEVLKDYAKKSTVHSLTPNRCK